MSGAKIIEGLKDAVAGNFSRVHIDGQTWARQDWQPITEDNQPPFNTPLLLGHWQQWPKREWIVEADFYGCKKGGWINSRATHWMPLPSPPREGGR